MTKSEALKLSYLALDDGLGAFRSQVLCNFEKISYLQWGNQKNEENKTCSLIYIIEGQGSLSFSNGQSESVGPGDVIQKLPGNSGCLSFQKGNSAQVVLTLPDFFYNIYDRNPLKGSDSPLFHIGLQADLLMKFRRLHDEISRWANPTIFRIIEKSLKLVAEVQATRLLIHSKSAFDPIWITIRRDLCRKLKNRFSLPDLAEKFNMSYSSFRQGFTKHIGMPPGVFHIEQRIEQVKMLLGGSQISLKEIANRFNYPDLPSFSKQFKKITGITPGKYIKIFDRPLKPELI